MMDIQPVLESVRASLGQGLWKFRQLVSSIIILTKTTTLLALSMCVALSNEIWLAWSWFLRAWCLSTTRREPIIILTNFTFCIPTTCHEPIIILTNVTLLIAITGDPWEKDPRRLISWMADQLDGWSPDSAAPAQRGVHGTCAWQTLGFCTWLGCWLLKAIPRLSLQITHLSQLAAHPLTVQPALMTRLPAQSKW